MTQLKISPPDYKVKLLEKLKSKLGRTAVRKIADRSDYSVDRVRKWFADQSLNPKIHEAGLELLKETHEIEENLLDQVESI